jgi:hypothetical protein
MILSKEIYHYFFLLIPLLVLQNIQNENIKNDKFLYHRPLSLFHGLVLVVSAILHIKVQKNLKINVGQGYLLDRSSDL